MKQRVTQYGNANLGAKPSVAQAHCLSCQQACPAFFFLAKRWSGQQAKPIVQAVAGQQEWLLLTRLRLFLIPA